MAFVELDGLTKRYGTLTVVNKVDLAIEKGTLVCLLGPSGCGKTTTLRLVAGFVQPSDGRIRVGGRVVSSPSGSEPPEARNMSMIFQSYALWPHMTVFENVAYGLRLRRMAKSDIETKTRRILQATKLDHLTYTDALVNDLGVMDATALSLCRDNDVRMRVFGMSEPGNVTRALVGENIGTLVTTD